jgi:hypothetical protein
MADSVLCGPHWDNYLLTGDDKLERMTTFKTLHFEHTMQSANKCLKNHYLEMTNPVTYWTFIDSSARGGRVQHFARLTRLELTSR